MPHVALTKNAKENGPMTMATALLRP